MSAGGIPRYFVPFSDPEAADPLHLPLAVHLLDAFRWRRSGRGLAEVAVVRDLRGRIHLHTGEPAELPHALRAALHHHELASGGLRTIDADALWLLDAEAMEQVPDTPGVNDPIYLRGHLVGPYDGTDAIVVHGRLALTRADLLAGVVQGEPYSLRLATAPSGGARCLHLAVPGGRTEEVARGGAYVLAYALVPYELQASDPANEAVVSQLVHDVLAALRSDLKAAGTSHWLLREALPTPSRADLEARLRAEGWEIRGASAVRPIGPNAGITGWLSQALGVDFDKAIKLPKEAPFPAFLALAQRALQSFPGFPDERAQAFARRVEGAAGSPARPGITWAEPAQKPGPRLTGALKVPPRPPGEREEWEAQFERAATTPGLGTRVTKVR